MGVINKTNPKGVDSVLDAIQQYIYPNLLGEGWTDYVCYPRANKNQRSGNIIPEVAQDQKDYIEVLFSDKHDATSFFLVDDVVAIDNEERLIVQRASIIFQVNLKNLFPGVTTHRADEELHVLLTELFTQNEELFVDVVGYTTTPDKVYSDLRIGDYNSDMWNDDMSEFHVVKYDFTVVYDLDDCSHRFSPTCAGVSIIIDGELFEVVPSGGTYSYSSAGSPASNQVNGASKTDIPAGGSKNFIIKDLDGDPVTVTQISDSASEFVGEVDTNIPVLYPQRGPYTMDESFYTGDEGYYRIDGRYDGHLSNQLPSNAIIQQLDDEIDTIVISNGYNIQRQRFYTILHDDSSITGMNHKHRFVSPYTGDYFDYSDSTNQSWFKDKDGNTIASNDWCVHPDYPTLQYFVDRLTMIGYIRGPQGSNFDAVATTYIQKLAAVISLNLMGKTDWMIQNKGESEKFLINHIYNPFSYAQTPFAWDAATLGAQPYYYLASCTLGYTTTDRFWYIGTINASGSVSTTSALYSSYQRYHEDNDWTWNN